MDTNGLVKDAAALTIEDNTALEEQEKMMMTTADANNSIQIQQQQQTQNKATIDVVVVESVEEKKNEDNSSTVVIEAAAVAEISSITTTISTSLIPSSRLRHEHRLKNRWTFWYLNADRELEWLERLKNVCTIESAETFWALFDNIRPPSGVLPGCDYNFFKQDIQPVWEVPENKFGGRLIVQIDKTRPDHMDILWLELLIALIGEQFGSDSDHICGAVCNIRTKGHKICLWTKDAEAEEVNRRIGTILKSRFQDTTNTTIKVNYEEHNVSQHKSSSATQVRFILQ